MQHHRPWAGLATGLAMALMACGGPTPDLDPRIKALWENPAVCGATPYRWVKSSILGDVESWEEEQTLTYDRTTIQASLRLSGITLASELRYNARLYRYRYQTQDRGKLTLYLNLVNTLCRVASIYLSTFGAFKNRK